MAEKKKAPRLYIRGIARYTKTDKAYKFDKAAKKSVPDPDGKLSIEVILDSEAAEAHQETIKNFAKEAGLKLANVKNWPFKPELDKDNDDEPTGRIVFGAWQYGKSKDGATRKMVHVDSRGKVLPSGFRLTSGSEVIIAVRPNAYKELGGGVNLYLDGVQVVKYVERDGNPGFGVVSDGEFTADDEDESDNAFTSNDSGEEADTSNDSNTDF
jgi:hypothetical protein